MTQTVAISTADSKKPFPYYVLILAVAIFYANVYDNTFLYDDMYLIRHNPYLLSWHSLSSIFFTYINNGAFFTGYFYRPIQNLAYLGLYQIFGASTFAFHLLNVCLHAINACLVFKLGCKLRYNVIAAFCAALIWAVHPIHTEAVTYMSATADPLYALFCLWGVIVLLPDFKRSQFWLAGGLFIFGLLSKETAIIFPLLVMSCLFLLSDERLKLRTYLSTWPLWIIATIYIVLRFVVFPIDKHALIVANPTTEFFASHFFIRFYTFLATLPTYFGILLWPTDLHMDRNFPVFSHILNWSVIQGLGLVFLMVVQLIWGSGQRRSPLSWGILWFFAAQLPHTGLFIPVNALLLEHWMYLPSVGLILGVTETLSREMNSYSLKPYLKNVAVTLALILALGLGYLTINQNAKWHDPLIFYSNILQYNKVSLSARTNLAIAYMERGDYQNADEQIELGLRIDNQNADLHLDKAILLAQEPNRASHIQNEITELNEAIKINPNLVPAYKQLATLYDYLGDADKASSYRAQAEEIRKKFFPPL